MSPLALSTDICVLPFVMCDHTIICVVISVRAACCYSRTLPLSMSNLAA